MPTQVTPKVFQIAETRLMEDGLAGFLNHLGVKDWKTDAASDAEELLEIAGKSCYLSFDTALNKNLTKTGTRNNFEYNQNIAKQKHGSVFEHATATFALMDVSRIFTHELVRHRVGIAFSQVSGRYVRADNIKYFLPSCLAEFADEANKVFLMQEEMYAEFVRLTGLDQMTDFTKKKEVTSALRRFLGNGIGNHIIVTANHRTLRHQIEVRTNRHAEEEIRIVFADIFDLLYKRYPSLYADAQVEVVNGIKEVQFLYSKI